MLFIIPTIAVAIAAFLLVHRDQNRLRAPREECALIFNAGVFIGFRPAACLPVHDGGRRLT
jgi:hypothetical protein